jgi:threonine dehydratase
MVKRLNLESKFYDSIALEKIAREEDWVIGDFQDITNGIELDGNKYPAYVDILKEILTDLGKEPDYIVVPAGTGILYNEFCDYILEKSLKTKVLGVTVTKVDSIADKLFGFYWQDIDNLNKVGYSITRYGRAHLMIRADDSEIINTMHEIGSQINAEPSGIAGLTVLHGLKKYYPSFDKIKDSVVVVNTGNGIPNFSLKKGV